MVLASHLWGDDEENLNQFGDEVWVCKIVSVAEHRLQPGDQGGGAGAGHHLSQSLIFGIGTEILPAKNQRLGDGQCRAQVWDHLWQELEAEQQEICHIVNNPLW